MRTEPNGTRTTARVLLQDQRNRVPYHLSTRCESASVHFCFFFSFFFFIVWWGVGIERFRLLTNFFQIFYILIDCQHLFNR